MLRHAEEATSSSLPENSLSDTQSINRVSIRLVSNLNRKDARSIVVNATTENSLFQETMRAASQKFRIKPRNVRLFDAFGREILALPLDGKQPEGPQGSHAVRITGGTTVIVSAGEELIPSGQAAVSALQLLKLKEEISGGQSAEVIVVAEETPIESSALQQLRWAAELPGVFLAVGLPDLHPGPSCPVGSAIATRGFIYPSLVGSDIGCGIRLVKTTLKASAATKGRAVDKWLKSLNMEGPWEGDTSELVHAAGLEPSDFDQLSLGTIGKGNHFAELQVVSSVRDEETAGALGLDADAIYLCVHSGSRGLGAQTLEDHTRAHGLGGLLEGSSEFGTYLTAHDRACRWASLNRQIIARRFLEQLQAAPAGTLLDICHNHVVPCPVPLGEVDNSRDLEEKLERSPKRSAWLHRKGAAPSDQGPVLIPGSRGSFSYLVMPAAAQDDLLKASTSSSDLPSSEPEAGTFHSDAKARAHDGSEGSLCESFEPCSQLAGDSGGQEGTGIGLPATDPGEATDRHFSQPVACGEQLADGREDATCSAEGGASCQVEETATGESRVHPSPPGDERPKLACRPGRGSGWSLAHGAGRKLARSAALAAGKAHYPNPRELTTTALGSRVVCEDKTLLYEEAPEAYKDVDSVILDLARAGLCTVIALMSPVLTYKVKGGSQYSTA